MSRPVPIVATACQIRELRDGARIVAEIAEHAREGRAVVLDALQAEAVAEYVGWHAAEPLDRDRE